MPNGTDVSNENTTTQSAPNPWHRQVVGTWGDFVRLAEESLTRTPTPTPLLQPVLYRGQASSAYGLEPSLLRVARNAKLEIPHLKSVENAALRDFQQQAHTFVPPALLSATVDAIDWWMLMQHYGAPTRLLDWTLSPYVAAYFAVRDNWDKEGTVWWVNAMILGHRTAHLADPKSGELTREVLDTCTAPTIFPLDAKLLNERMIAQQGLFTVGSHLEMAHDEAIQRRLSHTVLVTFGRWGIAAELKPKFLAHLHSMNITARSLFPGLDGFGKSIEEQARLRSHALATGDFHRYMRVTEHRD
jgi:hypothetical protein